MKNIKINGKFLSEVMKDKDGNFLQHNMNSLIIQALASPQNPEGANFNTMAQVIEVITKIREAKEAEYLLIENSLYDSLMVALKAMKWQVVDPAIYNFIKELSEAKDEAVSLREVAKDPVCDEPSKKNYSKQKIQ